MKNKKLMVKIATFLLAYAAIAPLSWGSAWFIGEPELPKRLKKDVSPL